jgi:NADH-quinone oxidoreductase subunit M
MSSIIFLIPFIAAIAILAGSPAKLTARIAGLATLIIGLYASFTWSCTCWNSQAILVFSNPKIHLSFGFLNGVSAVMIAMASLVTVAAVFTGKATIEHNKLYYSSTLFIAAGAIGAFLSTDLFFFYAFHELALIPTFLMIGILGRGDCKAIAWKITIYLGLGSIILLAGLIWLGQAAGTYNILQIINNQKSGALSIDPASQKSIAALLIVGFGTLISLFPFHSWAAPAYASAPAPTAMVHAGVLKKFGLYGLIQLALPVLPEGMKFWLIPLLVLLLGNIIWVGLITTNQKRLDTLLGNSSVMHMGYIFLAVAAVAAGKTHELGISAAATLMFAHGVSIAMLFSLSDNIERATGSLDLSDLGGLAKPAPKLAFLFGLAAMASIGLPGLANFAGEIQVFIAGFQGCDPNLPLAPVQIATIIALWGVVISAVYMLSAFRKIFHGSTVSATANASDISLLQSLPAYLLGTALLIVGVYPNFLLNLLK